MRFGALILGLAFAGFGCPSAHGQTSSSTVMIKVVPRDGEPTLDQFREYLALSGVGEIWRAGWVAAVELNWKRVAAPYWPASFEQDIIEEMKKTDLAPLVWNTYHASLSKDKVETINGILRDKGIRGYLASDEGKSFCEEWAKHEDEGKRQLLSFTTSVIQSVYERDKAQLDAARAKYLKDHPGYKD